MLHKISYLAFFILILLIPSSVHAATYYISPNGNDTSNSGTLESSPYKTFSKVWSKIDRGDTLILLDGTYTESTTGLLQVILPADDGRKVYIKAKNIGGAVIDGEYKNDPVVSFAFWQGGKNIDVEGIVAKNAGSDVNDTSAVWKFDTGRDTNANITLRKVSGYNADRDTNSAIFTFYQSSGITLEDCIAGGTGRKSILIYQSNNNVVRRCFVRWLRWDGAKWCGGLSWPSGSGVEVYYGNNNIIENTIGYGNVSYYHFAIKGYDIADKNQADNNQLLGDVSIYAGKYGDGTPVNWNNIKPSTTQCSSSNMTGYSVMNPIQTVGMSGDISYVSNTLIQDFVAYKAGGVFISGDYYGAGWENNKMNRVTVYGNGDLINSTKPDIVKRDYDKWGFTNSMINRIDMGNGQISNMKNGKATIQYRYVNGVLQDGTNGTVAQNLWPWPMEDQIRTQLQKHLAPEFGTDNKDLAEFSVTKRVCVDVLKGDTNIAASTECNEGSIPPTSVPTTTLSPTSRVIYRQPCTLTGDTNTCDAKVDVLDYTYISTKFGTTDTKADVKPDGKIDVLDYTVVSNNFGRKL
jgi:hypothetical protein